MSDDKIENEPATPPVVPEKPATTTDKYADYIKTHGSYKSIFHSDQIGWDRGKPQGGK